MWSRSARAVHGPALSTTLRGAPRSCGTAATASRCSSRRRQDGAGEIGEGDRFVAVWAGRSGPQPAAERPAALTKLGAEVAGLALRTDVDDDGLGEPAGEHQRRLVVGLAAEPEAALAAGVRPPDPAAVGDEGAAAARSGAFGRRTRCVTQRGRPPAGGGASSRP